MFIIDKQEIVNLRRSQAGQAWEEKEGDGVNTVLISGIFPIKVKKKKSKAQGMLEHRSVPADELLEASLLGDSEGHVFSSPFCHLQCPKDMDTQFCHL